MTLSEAETAVVAAARAGTRVDVRGNPVLRGPQLAEALRTAGDLRSVHIAGATVEGAFDLGFAEITAPLRFEDCDFDTAPDLSWTRLRFVSFTGCTLPGLRASNATVDGDISARGSALRGRLNLFHTRCSGNITLDDATLGSGISADSVVVEGGFFARGCTVDGEVRMRHARIGDALTFTGSTLRNPGRVAVRLDRATLGGGLFLGNGAEVTGEVRALSAEIHRTLSLTEGVFERTGGVALRFDAARVEGELDGRHKLRVRGAFRMEDAVVSGPVRLEGASLANPGGAALAANGLRAGGLLNCCDGFRAEGSVHLTGAQIGTRLCFDEATVEDLNCWRVQAGEITLRFAAPPGSIDLRYARTGVLRDDPATWPAVILLDGLTYDILDPQTTPARRVDWLSRDPGGHHRQPYEHLATVLRAQGRPDAARVLLLARQRRDTRRAGRAVRVWGYLQDGTVGYGYLPQRAAVIFAALLALGTVVFGASPPAAAEPAKAPPFNALIYTLDLLLPILDFGQQSAFVPRGAHQWASYAFIIAGVILATTIAAGLSRSLRRS